MIKLVYDAEKEDERYINEYINLISRRGHYYSGVVEEDGFITVKFASLDVSHFVVEDGIERMIDMPCNVENTLFDALYVEQLIFNGEREDDRITIDIRAEAAATRLMMDEMGIK